MFDLWNDPFASVGPLNTNRRHADRSRPQLRNPHGRVWWHHCLHGQVGPNDILRIDVQTQLPGWMFPLSGLEQANPQFPFEYSFEDVPTGTYWISAQLDIGGDNPTFPAGPEDPLGNIGPLLLPPGGAITTASFQLVVD